MSLMSSAELCNEALRGGRDVTCAGTRAVKDRWPMASPDMSRSMKNGEKA